MDTRIHKPWRGDIEDIDTYRLRGDIQQSLNRWLYYVAPEIDRIRSIPDAIRAEYALTFAIISPRCRFDKNVAATPDIVRAMRHNSPTGVLEIILRRHGIGLSVQKAERLRGAAQTIRQFTPDRAMLLSLRGVGPKVSAMALALYDDTLPVFTLDTHMLAGITGHDVNAISTTRYARLERLALDTIGQVTKVSPFAVQWCLWCDYSGQGFKSHLPIFGREPIK